MVRYVDRYESVFGGSYGAGAFDSACVLSAELNLPARLLAIVILYYNSEHGKKGVAMDAVVTARVPVEVKDQATRILRSIGATPTQLINAAYAYVLETGSLPHVCTHDYGDAQETPVVKSLSSEQRDALRADIGVMTRELPESFWQGVTYKQITEEGRRADYEALA